MRSYSKSIILLLLFIPSLINLAYTAEDIDLNKIVVTASRFEEDSGDVARNVDSINSREIERSQSSDLVPVLTDLTSANVSDYGSAGATKNLRMRGSTAAQVLVMVDGRPVNNPRDGTADLSTIPLDDISRVEVMHGPGSSLYGAGAMGGTVNIITKEPPREKQKTELYSSFGTFQTYNERFSHGARIAKFGYIVSGGYQGSEGSRGNSEFNANDFNSKLEYEITDNNKITFSSGYFRSRMGVPGPVTSFDADDKQRNVKNYQDFGWSFGLDEETQVSARVYQNYDRLEFIENTAGSAWETANTKDINTTRARGYNLELNKELFKVYRGVFGFNYVTNLNDSTVSAKHEYTVRAAYLENKLDLFDEHLICNFGARVDDYSNFGTQVNPSFGLLYKFNDRIKFLGSANRSFRAPTFNDLYWPDQGDGTKGNPNLSPEKGWTKEVGTEIEVSKYLTSAVTCYRSDYKQLINWTPDATGWMWTPTNVASAVIDGIEFENRIKFNDKLGLDLNYTYLRAKNKETDNYLVYQPKHKFDFSFKYKELNGFACELRGQFTDKRYYDAANSIKVKSFFVLGANVSKKFKSGITCFASIDNMLNRPYEVMRGYPMPGFAFNGGAKWEF
jgi:outer membrane receptor for ferrienterochelin and colicins